jgi:hypothetical protein
MGGTSSMRHRTVAANLDAFVTFDCGREAGVTPTPRRVSRSGLGARFNQGMAERREDDERIPEDEVQRRSTEKDPDEWVTGDEPMTGAQASYLRTLSREAGEEFDEQLTKAEASKRIDELQERTGRGQD